MSRIPQRFLSKLQIFLFLRRYYVERNGISFPPSLQFRETCIRQMNMLKESSDAGEVQNSHSSIHISWHIWSLISTEYCPSRGLRPADSYQGLFGSCRIPTHFDHTFFPGDIRTSVLTTFILTSNSSNSRTYLAFLFRISFESSFSPVLVSQTLMVLETLGSSRFAIAIDSCSPS